MRKIDLSENALPKLKRVQQGKVLSTVLYKTDVTDRSIATLFFYGVKRCCRGRIEIKYMFSWLLQNNLFGVEMLFEIQKPQQMPRNFYFKQDFSTSETTQLVPQRWRCGLESGARKRKVRCSNPSRDILKS